MASLGIVRPSVLHQNFPGKPKFTEKNIPDLTGKVYIVTGSNTGVGKELAQILYAANATVYMACRTESKAKSAMDEIKAAASESKGRLEFIHLDLGDLATIKPAFEAFATKENKLHVLFNNAGVMTPPAGQTTKQGYDMQVGTNCIGPFLFTQLLTPILVKTAAAESAGTVRVIWVASIATELYSPKYGIDMVRLKNQNDSAHSDALEMYGVSKAGNYFHAVEYARRHKKDGVVSVALNPGNLDSELYRSINEQKGIQTRLVGFFIKFILHPQKYGAYTELFAGLSPEVDMSKTGAWIGPWGRFFNMRGDVAHAAKSKPDGGMGVAEDFWNWTDEKVKSYL